MSIADRVWNGLAAIVKLDDKVTRQAELLREQQSKIQDLTARVIRLEAQLELLTSAAMTKRLRS